MCDDDTPDPTRRALGGAALVLAALDLAGPAAAQDAARVQPGAYKVVFENDKVRVTEYNARPSMGVCGVGLHSHPAHLSVVLSPARVKETVNGKSRIIENRLGDVFWQPAVTHEVENIGTNGVRSLIIELKPPPGCPR